MSITVITNIPTPVAMEGHSKPVPVYFDPSLVPGAPLSIVGVDLGKLGRGKSPAGPHRHDETEIYFLPDYGEPKARIKVMAGETTVVESPALVVIPAGVEHCFEVLDALPGQIIFGIFMPDAGKGE